MPKRMSLSTFIVIGLIFLSIACGSATPTGVPAATEEHTVTEAPAATVVERYSNGVVLELPNQKSAATLQSKETVLVTPLPTQVADGYELIRPIIYLDVYEAEKLVNSFDPPINFYVAIPDDLKELAASEKLVILLYDTVSKLWIPCDGKNQTDNTQCSATNFTDDFGRAWITIDKWTSGTGWGR